MVCSITATLCIAYKELFPIVLAYHVWGTSWARKRVEFQFDNTAVVSVIMSGTSKDGQLMHRLKALYLVSTRCNFQVTAKHIPGKTNRLADALARINMTELFELAHQAAPKPVNHQQNLQFYNFIEVAHVYRLFTKVKSNKVIVISRYKLD